jgi:hypothetical protein
MGPDSGVRRAERNYEILIKKRTLMGNVKIWVGCLKSINDLLRMKKVDMLMRSSIEIVDVPLKTIYHF